MKNQTIKNRGDAGAAAGPTVIPIDPSAIAAALGEKELQVLVLQNEINLLRRQNTELNELVERQAAAQQSREDGEDDQ